MIKFRNDIEAAGWFKVYAANTIVVSYHGCDGKRAVTEDDSTAAAIADRAVEEFRKRYEGGDDEHGD